jgi:PAS domain S-box-containing protein
LREEPLASLSARALRESRAQFRWLASIVESSDDAIISKDLDGIITSWNKGAERIFGYLAEEVIGKPITVLIPPERLYEEHVILSSIRHGDGVDNFETIRRRQTHSRPVDHTGQRLSLEQVRKRLTTLANDVYSTAGLITAAALAKENATDRIAAMPLQ